MPLYCVPQNRCFRLSFHIRSAKIATSTCLHIRRIKITIHHNTVFQDSSKAHYPAHIKIDVHIYSVPAGKELQTTVIKAKFLNITIKKTLYAPLKNINKLSSLRKFYSYKVSSNFGAFDSFPYRPIGIGHGAGLHCEIWQWSWYRHLSIIGIDSIMNSAKYQDISEQKTD